MAQMMELLVLKGMLTGDHDGHPADRVGCTANCVAISATEIVCANAGDCRAVLSRGGKSFNLSVDHKPSEPSERKRIEAAGSTVTVQSRNGRVIHRVNGLSLSRAIGDLAQKQRFDLAPEQQAITAAPEVMRLCRDAADEFLLIACDGIWDVKSSQQACDFVRARLRTGANASQILKQLLDSCLSTMGPKKSGGLGCDNMTCILILFEGGICRGSGRRSSTSSVGSVAGLLRDSGELALRRMSGLMPSKRPVA